MSQPLHERSLIAHIYARKVVLRNDLHPFLE